MRSVFSFGRIRLINKLSLVFAVATIVAAARVEVCAQEVAPQLSSADASASSDLLGGKTKKAERRSVFRNLFADPDSVLVVEPNSFNPLTDRSTSVVGLGTLTSPSRLDLQGGQAQHPEPAHTGFKALLFETASDFNAYPRRRSTWVILGVGGAAAALAHPADEEVNNKLAGSDAAGKFFAPGKYIGAFYTQVGVATGLYVVGRYVLPHAEGGPRTNKLSHIGFDMLRALILSQTVTQGIKIAVRRDRPDGECCAFPSGHASATFATAAVIERHFGYRGSWPMFLIASYVATSRLHDNRHFLSDVIFGAAVGVSTGWTVVGRHGRSQFALTPVPVRGGMMLALTRRTPSTETR